MPTGPKGEKRPADPVANAVHVMRVATGETEEVYVEKAKSQAGTIGGKARAKSMTAERRSEVARKAAAARWTD